MEVWINKTEIVEVEVISDWIIIAVEATISFVYTVKTEVLPAISLLQANQEEIFEVRTVVVFKVEPINSNGNLKRDSVEILSEPMEARDGTVISQKVAETTVRITEEHNVLVDVLQQPTYLPPAVIYAVIGNDKLDEIGLIYFTI